MQTQAESAGELPSMRFFQNAIAAVVYAALVVFYLAFIYLSARMFWHGLTGAG